MTAALSLSVALGAHPLAAADLVLGIARGFAIAVGKRLADG